MQGEQGVNVKYVVTELMVQVDVGKWKYEQNWQNSIYWDKL